MQGNCCRPRMISLKALPVIPQLSRKSLENLAVSIRGIAYARPRHCPSLKLYSCRIRIWLYSRSKIGKQSSWCFYDYRYILTIGSYFRLISFSLSLSYILILFTKSLLIALVLFDSSLTLWRKMLGLFTSSQDSSVSVGSPCFLFMSLWIFFIRLWRPLRTLSWTY